MEKLKTIARTTISTFSIKDRMLFAIATQASFSTFPFIRWHLHFITTVRTFSTRRSGKKSKLLTVRTLRARHTILQNLYENYAFYLSVKIYRNLFFDKILPKLSQWGVYVRRMEKYADTFKAIGNIVDTLRK